MFELIYSSRSIDTIDEIDITAILNTSRDFNKKNKITGCLLYHNNEFIQILEGDEIVVKKLYASILKDKRHHNILLLAEGLKQERDFKDWNMAYHELTDNNIKAINKEIFSSNFMAFSQFAEKPTHAIKLFWYMAYQLVIE